jgi:hypothetical protein
MKAYHEYLELHGYFAQPGEPRLLRAAFDEADREYHALAARHQRRDAGERARLGELKAMLFRDKP